MSQIFHPTAHETEIADLVQRLPNGDEEAFWRQHLRGIDQPALLGSTRERVTKGESSGQQEIFFSSALNESLDAIARKLELSRDTIYLTGWSVLLSRYSADAPILFGARFSSLQSNPERLWPVSLSVKSESSVGEVLRDIQKMRDDLRKREPVSERDLHLWCEVQPEQILIETVLDFTESSDSLLPGQPLELRFSADENSITFAFWTRHFTSDAIRRLGEQYICLLEELAAKPLKNVAQLSILPLRQREQILNEWNITDKTFPEYSALHQLFEKKAAEVPETVAVEFPKKDVGILFERQITYHELNFRANQLAHHLQRLGVNRDVVVGICMDRSIEMVVAVLAVLKAGGAYAPLDPTYPKERLAFMLEDTNAPVILTEQKFAKLFTNVGSHVLCLDVHWNQISTESGDNLNSRVGKNHLAYLIYTSGSTGQPKGVAMRQGPLLNLLFWQMSSWHGIGPARTLQFASLNFDVSFQEIFSTWCSGGTLLLITDDQRRDSRALARFLEEQKIERLFLPFVALKHLAEACDHENIFPRQLREVITAGEQLQITPHISSFFSRLPRCTLENQYGPSETHVVTAHRLNGLPINWPALPSIGKPIANSRVYILDRQKQPVPIGVPGEIYLGGVCLARGYLNRPDLTAEKFLSDPFLEGERMYKTGDLARWLPDGTIEFLGRIDHQVKVRGFRIELGEVEAVLSRHRGVREAVVIARDNLQGEKQLVAYLVSRNGALSSAELRGYLLQHIPSYCVPAAFVTLPVLPTTPNGKVDRKSLPEPNLVEESPTKIKRPENPLELQLKLVFEKFFQRRPIGTDVSFFELGGDSLQALKLVVELERATSKKLPLNILYQAPTVEMLAKEIHKQSPGGEFSSLVPLQPHGKRPPLFLIHTTPGDVLGYGNLIFHLDSDQPCFGFQSRGLGRAELSHHTIEEMAAHYIRDLRKVQPRGPYQLGGWCYGGIVAVEMAHQLRAAGEKVAPLLLIETPAPTPPLTNIFYYTRRIGRLLCMKPSEWRIYLTAKTKYYRGRRTANELRFRRVDQTSGTDAKAVEQRNQLLEQLEQVYHTNLTAWQHYKPRFYAGEIILFNAAQQDPAMIQDPLYGWPALAAKIEAHFIPGTHDTILMEPHVQVLAEKMNHCLLKAQQTAR